MVMIIFFIQIQPWNSEHLRTVNVILWSRQCCDDSIPLLFWTLCFYLITCQSDTVCGRTGRRGGGRRGKIFYISWQPKPLNITWMDQTGGKNNFMVCPNYSRSCKNTTCGGGQARPWWCPVIPVTITMFSQPLLSKFLCITNLMIYSLLV